MQTALGMETHHAGACPEGGRGYVWYNDNVLAFCQTSFHLWLILKDIQAHPEEYPNYRMIELALVL